MAMMRRMRALGLGSRRCTAAAARRRRRRRRRCRRADRLPDRREVAAGTRAYAIGFQDGGFYANGWHITGEMGGIWAPPLKLADGVWFGVDDQWVGARDALHQRPGYTRYDAAGAQRPAPAPHRLRPRRAPRRAVRARARQPDERAKTVTVKVDVHSELLGAYPWTGSKDHPTAADNLPGHGRVPRRRARLHRRARSRAPRPTTTPRWSRPRGPRTAPTSAPASAARSRARSARTATRSRRSACDDGPHGKGAGGQLRYSVTVPGQGREAVWIAVAGSDAGLAAAQHELDAALRDPDAQLATKIAARERARRALASTSPATARCRTRSSGASRTSPT